MLPLLNDLRKYITKFVKIEEYGTAWYMKELLERCKDEELTNRIINGVTSNVNEIRDGGHYPFEYLIADYHMEDIFGTNNVILKLILSCFTTQFIIDEADTDIIYNFLKYTKRGRQISGYSEELILAEYIQKSWKELEDEFSGILDNDLIDEFKGNSYDISEEYAFCSSIIVTDEREPIYSSVRSILIMIGFAEVCPGLFYYAGFGYYGCEFVDITMSKDALDDICDNIMLQDKVRNLNNVNELVVFDEEDDDDYLFMLMKDKISRKEVLF